MRNMLAFAPGSRARACCVGLTAALVGMASCAEPEERSTSWTYVHTAILAPACATSSCHSAASSAAGLDLSTRTSAYSYFLGRPCDGVAHPQDAPGNYVFPFRPERSRLIALLRGNPTTIMPPDTPLPASEVALVEGWILEGAPCD